MTPEERAVFEAAYRVASTADLPDGPLHAKAMWELDDALAAWDRQQRQARNGVRRVFADKLRRLIP